MRALILSVVLIAATAPCAVAAGPGWHGPGWYVVMNTPVKQNSLYRGSYKTRDDCIADKPADHGMVTYDCIEIDHEPLGGGF